MLNVTVSMPLSRSTNMRAQCGDADAKLIKILRTGTVCMTRKNLISCHLAVSYSTSF